MSWDAFQREALAEMGCRLYVATDPSAQPLPDDPLLLALLRAAGRTPASADAARLFRQWPPTSSLRADPAAKRALWPALRALRGAARP